MRTRLRRLPVAIAIGGLWALLDPNGRWLAGVLGAVVVLFVPEVQPWLVAHLRRPGEVPGALRHPVGGWVAGTVKKLDDGIRWRADDEDVEPREVHITSDRFTFGGYSRDEAQPGREVLALHTAGGGQLDLAVAADQGARLAAGFRLASDR